MSSYSRRPGDEGTADVLGAYNRLYPQANGESPLQQLAV